MTTAAEASRGDERPQPYFWVTWLTGLLSGDAQCEWRAWFKAHRQGYDKREDPDQARLDQWKSEHAAMVRGRALALEEDGWTVRQEAQNRFHYHGQAATVGGCPDLVGLRLGELCVEDCKSGQQRASDTYQVIFYMKLYPLTEKKLAALPVEGAVIYHTRLWPVTQDIVDHAWPAISETVRRLAAPAPPRRVPSAGECVRCDILCCPDRDETPQTAVATGDLF